MPNDGPFREQGPASRAELAEVKEAFKSALATEERARCEDVERLRQQVLQIDGDQMRSGWRGLFRFLYTVLIVGVVGGAVWGIRDGVVRQGTAADAECHRICVGAGGRQGAEIDGECRCAGVDAKGARLEWTPIPDTRARVAAYCALECKDRGGVSVARVGGDSGWYCTCQGEEVK